MPEAGRSATTVDAFAEYVEVVAERLGDRVKHWITHNEPWVVAWIGHGWGHHAPGRTSEPDALATAHHLLLSHGRAVEILRRASPGLAGRHHVEPRPRVRRQRRPGRRGRRAVGRRVPQPLVPRPDLPRRLPGGHGRGVGRDHAGGPRRRPRDDLRADRLPRRQQLLVAARRSRPERGPLADRAAAGCRAHRHGLGDHARRPA